MYLHAHGKEINNCIVRSETTRGLRPKRLVQKEPKEKLNQKNPKHQNQKKQKKQNKNKKNPEIMDLRVPWRSSGILFFLMFLVFLVLFFFVFFWFVFFGFSGFVSCFLVLLSKPNL